MVISGVLEGWRLDWQDSSEYRSEARFSVNHSDDNAHTDTVKVRCIVATYTISIGVHEIVEGSGSLLDGKRAAESLLAAEYPNYGPPSK